jgi:hypothetical protein
MSALRALPDLDVLARTREAWHALAEHVLASARHRATGRIGLVVVPGGFGTPPFAAGAGGDDEEIQVIQRELVVRRGETTRSAPIRTLREAATLVGITPGAPTEVFRPTTALDPDEYLDVDDSAATALASWFALGWNILNELCGQVDATESPSTAQLWPEHFDASVDLGNAAAGQRGTFGVSPGDLAHPAPYLYVTHWADAPDDPFWNATTFRGARIPYIAIQTAPDPTAAAHEFFAEGRARLLAL